MVFATNVADAGGGFHVSGSPGSTISTFVLHHTIGVYIAICLQKLQTLKTKGRKSLQVSSAGIRKVSEQNS